MDLVELLKLSSLFHLLQAVMDLEILVKRLILILSKFKQARVHLTNVTQVSRTQEGWISRPCAQNLLSHP